MPIRPLPLVTAIATALAPMAHASCARDAMLVMDGSASMAEVGFTPSAPTRIMDAREALRQAMPQIAPVRRVGLISYGPGGVDSCSGINVNFAPVADASGPVIGAVEALDPGGLTPIAASVEAAAQVLGGDGIVVLVTDGNETCGGRPCALGKDLATVAPDLTVHVIGFRVVYDPFAWDSPEAGVFSGGDSVARCLADATGGMYVSTETVDELAEALQETLGCALIGLRSKPEQKRKHPT